VEPRALAVFDLTRELLSKKEAENRHNSRRRLSSHWAGQGRRLCDGSAELNQAPSV